MEEKWKMEIKIAIICILDGWCEKKEEVKNMFNPGIEPGTVCVLGRRDNHYTN